MWEDCVRELKSYDRTIRSAATEDLTAEKYEALPEELRQGDHPEFDLWWDSKTQHADENGWTILPVSELAHIKNIVKRATLTRRQSLSLVATAGALGLAIEPDVRLTGKNYKWDEVVAVFMPEDGNEGDPAIYRAAATLLQLGFTIAEADGVIDKAELDHITQHLEEQFALTDSQSARLQRLSYLLQRTRSNASSVGKHLQKTLSLEQRRRVGEFLVGIAATDQVTTIELPPPKNTEQRQ